MKLKLSGGNVTNDEPNVLSRPRKKSFLSKSEVPMSRGLRKSSIISSRQHLYPSYKRIDSKVILTPIDSTAQNRNIKVQSEESFVLQAKLLSSDCLKKETTKVQKKIKKRNSIEFENAPSSPSLATCEELISSYHPPVTDKISPSKNLEIPAGRRFSLPKLSLGKMDLPTTLIEQWTVHSSTTNSALHLVVDN